MDLIRVEAAFTPSRDKKCTVARRGMVSSAFPLASRAGAAMLEKGGNAVDAAAAAAMTLCVCEPQACGLGGQTLVLIHYQGRSFFLDGSGRIPALARLDQFGPEDREHGYKATSVPTTVAVLGAMVRDYGRLSWSDIVAPALSAARNGYPITSLQQRLQNRELSNFDRVPSRSGANYFLKNGTKPFNPGDLFVQSDLADLLDILSRDGPEAFYTDRITGNIEKDMRANGGFLRAADMSPIPWPVIRPAIGFRYRDLDLITAPPPTAGRSLCILLKFLEDFPKQYLVSPKPEAYWDLAQTIRKVLTERRTKPVWPDKYDFNQDAAAKDPTIINQMPISNNWSGDYDGQTTHLSTMDAEGDAVGLTQSINMVYASKAAAAGLGFLYNNYLLDCHTADPHHPHYLHPGNRPATTVIPLFVMQDGRPWLVAGSPGSERILSTVAQFLISVIDSDLPICESMRKPRLHYSLEGVLSIEGGRYDPEIVTYLEKNTSELSIRKDYSFYLGAIHATLRCLSKDEFQGVAEVRRDGIALGIE
jgi:gamma-glutamyltranspeptidase/glutathione hydrolase